MLQNLNSDERPLAHLSLKEDLLYLRNPWRKLVVVKQQIAGLYEREVYMKSNLLVDRVSSLIRKGSVVTIMATALLSSQAQAQSKPSLLILPPPATRFTYKIETEQGIAKANEDLKKDFMDHLVTQIQACLQKTDRFEIKDKDFLDDIDEEKKKILRGDVQFDGNVAGELGISLFLRIKSVDLVFTNGNGFQTKLTCSVKAAIANAQGKVIGQLIEKSDRAIGAFTEPLDPSNAGESRYRDAFNRIGAYIVKSLPKDEELAAKSTTNSAATSSVDPTSINEAYRKSKFLVLITDSTVGQDSGGPANTAIIGKLTNAGLNVIDKDASNDLLEQARREIQKQALSEAFLNSLRRKFGADYVLLGSAVSEPAFASGNSGSVFVTHLNARLIRIDDARTMFSENASGRTQDVASESGKRIAAEKAANQIGDKLLTKLKGAPAEVSAPKGDDELNLTVQNLGNYLLSAKLVKALKELDNVVDAQRTAYANASATIRLIVKHGETDSVLTAISESKSLKTLLGGALVIKSVTDNNIQMAVSKGYGG